MQTFLSAQNSRVNYRVFFLTGPPLFSTKMKKGLTSQPEALSDEGFHGTAALFGSLVFFISVLNRGGAVDVVSMKGDKKTSKGKW